MKCDDFLPAFATGGVLRRIQAFIHAARCSRCAAVRKHFMEAKRHWGQADALTEFHRAAWRRAMAAEPMPAPRRVPLAAKWAFASVAFLLVVVGTLILTGLPRHQAVVEVAQDRSPTGALKVPSAQNQLSDQISFVALERALDEIAVELNDLEKQAALLDVRKDLELLLTTYKPLDLPQPTQSESN